MQPARLLLRAANAKIAGLAGIGRQLTSVMVNTKNGLEATHILQGPGEAAERIRSERASASRQAGARASQQAEGHERFASKQEIM